MNSLSVHFSLFIKLKVFGTYCVVCLQIRAENDAWQKSLALKNYVFSCDQKRLRKGKISIPVLNPFEHHSAPGGSYPIISAYKL